jgi:hypothetical protein
MAAHLVMFYSAATGKGGERGHVSVGVGGSSMCLATAPAPPPPSNTHIPSVLPLAPSSSAELPETRPSFLRRKAGSSLCKLHTQIVIYC